MISRISADFLAWAVLAECAVGNIATLLRRLSREHSQKSGRHGHAYGSVGRPISREPWSDSPGCPAEQNPQGATPQGAPGVGVPRAAYLDGHDPGGLAHWLPDLPDELLGRHAEWPNKQPNGGDQSL